MGAISHVKITYRNNDSHIEKSQVTSTLPIILMTRTNDIDPEWIKKIYPDAYKIHMYGGHNNKSTLFYDFK